MSAPPAERRLDASMTLLREVMERPLDPSYAAAAAAPRPTTPLRTAVTLLLAVLAGLSFVVAVSSIRQPERDSTQVNKTLRNQIERRTAAVGRKEAANQALSAENAVLRKDALGAAGAALNAQVQGLSLAAGEIPVSGPGLRLTVDDAPGQGAAGDGSDPRSQPADSDGTVFDGDLQVIVNGLWAAGAEAIDIGGHRLTALSAIREAGQAILVDFRPLVPPYVIQAVGDPNRMQSDFATGPAGAYVQAMRDNDGIRVDIAAVSHLSLAGAGQLVLHEAHPVATPTPSGAPAQATPTPEETK